MSSPKSSLRSLAEKEEVILISDDEDEQDSEDATNDESNGMVPFPVSEGSDEKTEQASGDVKNDESNGMVPFPVPEGSDKTEGSPGDVKGPEARCLMSLGINKPDCKTELPGELDATETTLEASHIPPLAIDEPLITPLPVNEGETFNRAEYQIPPRLVEMSEQSNKSVIQLLDICMPHVRERDRPLILQKIKELLNQTNLHYLVSDRFRMTVASIVNSVEKNNSSENVYMRIKELADELRSRREKKSKKRDASSVMGEGSTTPSTAFTGSSEEDTSDSRRGTPAPRSASSPATSQSGLLASVSPVRSSSTTPDSLSMALTEVASAAAGGKDRVGESVGPVKENHEEKWRNGIHSSMGETSGVWQKSEKELRTEHYIRKLERHLMKLNRAIKTLHEEEVDFDCDDRNSAYIQEDKLKRKAVAVWKKICELEQRRATTGREREMKFHYKGTTFPEINAMVEKVINKRHNNLRVFPDFKDILDAVHSGNEAHSLGLSSREEKFLAEKVFQEVGRELQRRRKLDERTDVLAYLEDGPGSSLSDDPAENDPELREKLESNAKLCQQKLNQVIEMYVAKQEELKLEPKEVEQENCDLSSQPSESSESEDEEDDGDNLRTPDGDPHDVGLNEGAVKQEKIKPNLEGVCNICITSNNSCGIENSQCENSRCEGEDGNEEECVKVIEKDLKEEECMEVIAKDLSESDGRSSKADSEEADAKEEAGAEAAWRGVCPITVEDKEGSPVPPADGGSHSIVKADSEEADAKEEAGAEAACGGVRPITVEVKESSPAPPADGGSHSIVKDVPLVEKTDTQENLPSTALGQESLPAGTETTSEARDSDKEVPLLPARKRECSFKQRPSLEEDVITILSDDEELPPPAKVPRHTSL